MSLDDDSGSWCADLGGVGLLGYRNSRHQMPTNLSSDAQAQ